MECIGKARNLGYSNLQLCVLHANMNQAVAYCHKLLPSGYQVLRVLMPIYMHSCIQYNRNYKRIPLYVKKCMSLQDHYNYYTTLEV